MENEKDNEIKIENKNKNNVITIKDIIVFILTILIVTGIFHIIQPVSIAGASMEPTFQNKDIVMKSTFQYKLTEPKRGDIVIIKSDYDNAGHIIKRIIGLPGDKLEIKKGEVYVNGKETREDMTLDEMTIPKEIPEMYEVPEGHYFVMGDNRQNSADSREPEISYVSEKDLEGRVLIRIFPFDKVKVIKNMDVFDTSNDNEIVYNFDDIE